MLKRFVGKHFSTFEDSSIVLKTFCVIRCVFFVFLRKKQRLWA